MQGKKHKGSVTVEAAMVVPIFLFFWMFMAKVMMILFADAHIHQALAEAAIDSAQQCYLENKLLLSQNDALEYIAGGVYLNKKFQNYLGEDFFVEKTVLQGKKGIQIKIKRDLKNRKVWIVKAVYFVKIDIPFFDNFHLTLTDTIKQKAFIGYSKEEDSEEYVYITPNQAVYHRKRSCTHLKLDVKVCKSKGNYQPCRFCVRDVYQKGKVYVTRTGDVYHMDVNCSGLKRTVYRVRISEINGMKACERCGG